MYALGWHSFIVVSHRFYLLSLQKCITSWLDHGRSWNVASFCCNRILWSVHNLKEPKSSERKEAYPKKGIKFSCRVIHRIIWSLMTDHCMTSVWKNFFSRTEVGARVVFSPVAQNEFVKCAVFLLAEKKNITFMLIYIEAPEALCLPARFHIIFCQFGQWNYVMFVYDIPCRTK